MKTKDYYNINSLTKENSMRYSNKLKEKNAIKILLTYWFEKKKTYKYCIHPSKDCIKYKKLTQLNLNKKVEVGASWALSITCVFIHILY